MRILLLTGGVIDIDASVSSRDMLVSGLIYWFSKKDYEIVTYNVNPLINGTQSPEDFLNDLPACDVLLLRLFTASWVVQNVQEIRERLGCKIVSFIEHKQDNMDLSVGFLKSTNPDIHIPFPYIERYMINKQKEKNTILLDGQEENTVCMLKEITDWLSPLANTYKIYQLGGTPLAEYVEVIPKSNYKKYMENTAKMEFFIQTHKGSYEHSIIDMAGRGIKVLVYPNLVAEEIITGLELPIYRNQEELIKLIENIEVKDVLNKMTPMEEIVNLLDERFKCKKYS